MGVMIAESGNFTGNVWHDSDANLISETNSNFVSTTASFSSVFTLAGGNYDGIILFLAMRAVSPSGTITVGLWKGASGSQVLVSGTEVTVNAADFKPIGSTRTTDGGPLLFKWSSLVNCPAGNDYWIRTQSSVANTVGFHNNGTSNNFSRLVRYASAGAAVASNDLLICRELVSAGVNNVVTVTFDGTAPTDYGTDQTSTATPALAVGDGGKLINSTASGQAFFFRVSGHIVVYWGGEISIGALGSPLHPTSTFELVVDCLAAVGYGILARGDCICKTRHESFPTQDANGDANVFARLTADLASGAGTAAGAVQVTNTTDWAVGDEIEISSTRLSGSAHDNRTISAIASGTAFSLNSNASAIHDGNAAPYNPRAVVLNLRRNITIRGASSANTTYFRATRNGTTFPTIDFHGTAFKWFGSATTNQRGFNFDQSGGSVNINRCVFREWTGNTSFTVNFILGSTAIFSMQNCIFWQVGSLAWSTNSGQNGDYPTAGYKLWNNVFCRGASGAMLNISVPQIDFQRNIVYAGATSNAAFAGGYLYTLYSNTFKDFESFIGGGSLGGSSWIQGWYGTCENVYSWRNTTTGGNTADIMISGNTEHGELVFLNLRTHTSSLRRAVSVNQGIVRLVTPTLDMETGAATGLALYLGGNPNGAGGSYQGRMVVEGGSISSKFNIPIGVNTNACAELILLGVTSPQDPAASGFVDSPQKLINGFIQVINHNNDQNKNFGWVPLYGRTNGPALATDIVTTPASGGSSPVLSVYPGSSSNKIKTPTFSVPVQSGQSATPSVKVRESTVPDGALYNGNPPRLCVRRNYLAGISSDTVIAVHSGTAGVWETLSGSTVAVSRNCVLEFYVDCDGTAGWISVDDFSCSSVDSGGMQFFSETKLSPWVVSGSGGGGGAAAEQKNPFLTTVIG